jgi:hypothetical protein
VVLGRQLVLAREQQWRHIDAFVVRCQRYGDAGFDIGDDHAGAGNPGILRIGDAPANRAAGFLPESTAGKQEFAAFEKDHKSPRIETYLQRGPPRQTTLT